MSESTIGIGDIALYVPRPKIALTHLIDHRVARQPELERRLRRALHATGQRAIRYPHYWEDSVTMSAQAADMLLSRRKATINLQKLRYLVVGSETTIDHAKPIAAFVGGMLQNIGFEIPEHISTFQVQHACAGGTLAVASIGALLALGSDTADFGLAICSDIARYEASTTAELTQGAGAAALLIERNPRLIELDLARPGYASRDVDDFFRPLGSATAQVQGGYSMECYNRALISAFEDYCRRIGDNPSDVLMSTDLFALHVPFARMARIAVQKLITRYGNMSHTQIESFLSERNFGAALEATADVGNIYSGSAYLSLAFLLDECYRAQGHKIVGKRLLLCSYGSGNTMVILGGRVSAAAPEIIAGWDMQRVIAEGTSMGINHYENWVADAYSPSDAYTVAPQEVLHGSFYLSAIRANGYREYGYRR